MCSKSNITDTQLQVVYFHLDRCHCGRQNDLFHPMNSICVIIIKTL